MGDALEELRAMNAAPSGGRGPVRNQDKRTSRLDNKDSFQRAILQHRAELPAAIGIPAPSSGRGSTSPWRRRTRSEVIQQ